MADEEKESDAVKEVPKILEERRKAMKSKDYAKAMELTDKLYDICWVGYEAGLRLLKEAEDNGWEAHADKARSTLEKSVGMLNELFEQGMMISEGMNITRRTAEEDFEEFRKTSKEYNQALDDNDYEKARKLNLDLQARTIGFYRWANEARDGAMKAENVGRIKRANDSARLQIQNIKELRKQYQAIKVILFGDDDIGRRDENKDGEENEQEN